MTQRYEVKGKIGQGGLGQVFLAYDTQLDREVALKRVRTPEGGEESETDMHADLVREAKTLSALQHPNIVTIYDVGRDASGPFVIMEFLKGETLEAVIERGTLSELDFREIVLQVLEGMVAAQALGLVHRDLKPGNIMVNWLASGRIQLKILDFGLAKFSRLAVPQTQDQGDGIFGSIYFMAPEQFERLPLDARTDLYSLGCIFYQLLAQKHPFDGRTAVDVMVSHMQHLVTPLHEARPDLPAWMADWVMWLISREMDDRPPDAQTALEYFNAQKSGLPSASAAAPATRVPTVRIVGRGAAPGHATQQVHAGAGAQTRPVAGGATQRVRGGSHSTAVSSRPRARRVDGKVRGLPKEKVTWVTVLTALLVLGGGAGTVWYLYKDSKKPKPSPRDILTTLQGDAPQGAPDTVNVLVDLAETGGDNATDAFAVLRKLRGPGVPEEIAAELKKADGPVRDLLIETVGTQPSKAGMTALAEIAFKESGEARPKALAAIVAGGGRNEIIALLKQVEQLPDETSRRTWYQTVSLLLAKEPTRDDRVKVLVPVFLEANHDARQAILQLLGMIGGPEANSLLTSEINAGDVRLRAAVEALKTWNTPDQALADALFRAAEKGNHDLLTGAYSRAIARVPSLTGAEIATALRKAIPLADTETSRKEFAAALGTLGSPQAAALATELTTGQDPGLASAVKKVVDNVGRQSERALTLKSGQNELEARHAVIVGPGRDAEYSSTLQCITGWRSRETRIGWDVIVSSPVEIEIDVLQSTPKPGASFFVSTAGMNEERPVTVTASTDDFARISAGKVTLPRPGTWRIWLEPGRINPNQELANIRSLILQMK